MVNHGPSQGCDSCRRRRKLCDGTRPVCSRFVPCYSGDCCNSTPPNFSVQHSCIRCTKANRTCRGYEDIESSAFRQYGLQDPNPSSSSSSFTATALKCNLPKRIPIPGTNILPEDKLPAEISEAASDVLALRAFVYDYCVIPANQNLSRGFLSGLESMAFRSGPKSDLVKACQAVAYATHGKVLNRPLLVNRAKLFYQELLGSLARAIQNQTAANFTELKLVAMLLGIFQVAMTNETDHDNQNTHAKGLAALMRIGPSPLNLLVTIQSGSITGPNKHLPAHGIFSVLALSDKGQSLDSLLLKLDSLWAKYESSFQLDHLRVLKTESIALDRHFSEWQDSRVTEFKPTTIGQVNLDSYTSGSDIAVGYWQGKVDTYFDLYVASAWNTFRTARLLLITLIVKLSNALRPNDSCAEHIDTAHCIVNDIIASVPYHLVDNLPSFLSEVATSKEITDPGRSLGGLLLMHPLYIASKTPFPSQMTQEYLQSCLVWIGSNMGIAQATLLAEAQVVDRNHLENECMLIWSGFLG